FGRDRLLGAPDLFWVMLLLVALVGVVLAHTRPGRHAIALGGGRDAAVTRGISRARVRITTFAFAGMCAAAGGVMTAAQLDVVETGVGQSTQFQVITAVVLGGISLSGGRGDFLGLLASLVLL